MEEFLTGRTIAFSTAAATTQASNIHVQIHEQIQQKSNRTLFQQIRAASPISQVLDKRPKDSFTYKQTIHLGRTAVTPQKLNSQYSYSHQLQQNQSQVHPLKATLPVRSVSVNGTSRRTKGDKMQISTTPKRWVESQLKEDQQAEKGLKASGRALTSLGFFSKNFLVNEQVGKHLVCLVDGSLNGGLYDQVVQRNSVAPQNYKQESKTTMSNNCLLRLQARHEEIQRKQGFHPTFYDSSFHRLNDSYHQSRENSKQIRADWKATITSNTLFSNYNKSKQAGDLEENEEEEEEDGENHEDEEGDDVNQQGEGGQDRDKSGNGEQADKKAAKKKRKDGEQEKEEGAKEEEETDESKLKMELINDDVDSDSMSPNAYDAHLDREEAKNRYKRIKEKSEQLAKEALMAGTKQLLQRHNQGSRNQKDQQQEQQQQQHLPFGTKRHRRQYVLSSKSPTKADFLRDQKVLIWAKSRGKSVPSKQSVNGREILIDLLTPKLQKAKGTAGSATTMKMMAESQNSEHTSLSSTEFISRIITLTSKNSSSNIGSGGTTNLSNLNGMPQQNDNLSRFAKQARQGSTAKQESNNYSPQAAEEWMAAIGGDTVTNRYHQMSISRRRLFSRNLRAESDKTTNNNNNNNNNYISVEDQEDTPAAFTSFTDALAKVEKNDWVNSNLGDLPMLALSGSTVALDSSGDKSGKNCEQTTTVKRVAVGGVRRLSRFHGNPLFPGGGFDQQASSGNLNLKAHTNSVQHHQQVSQEIISGLECIIKELHKGKALIEGQLASQRVLPLKR